MVYNITDFDHLDSGGISSQNQAETKSLSGSLGFVSIRVLKQVMKPLGTFRSFQIELFQFVEVIGLPNEKQSHLASVRPHDDVCVMSIRQTVIQTHFNQCVPTIQAACCFPLISLCLFLRLSRPRARTSVIHLPVGGQPHFLIRDLGLPPWLATSQLWK